MGKQRGLGLNETEGSRNGKLCMMLVTWMWMKLRSAAVCVVAASMGKFLHVKFGGSPPTYHPHVNMGVGTSWLLGCYAAHPKQIELQRRTPEGARSPSEFFSSLGTAVEFATGVLGHGAARDKEHET